MMWNNSLYNRHNYKYFFFFAKYCYPPKQKSKNTRRNVWNGLHKDGGWEFKKAADFKSHSGPDIRYQQFIYFVIQIAQLHLFKLPMLFFFCVCHETYIANMIIKELLVTKAL